MGETKHVVLTAEVYGELLGYLSKTQIYENVAPLISKVVNDANVNSQTLNIVINPVEAEPEAPAGLTLLKDDRD